ncbi:MAG: HIT domain-containing protein [Actinobacteria bacterium]|nr:MAG: HIT domain-containing protein [Actinomycetota bacterium]
MERLWSPWRMEYIQASKDVVEDRCVFCALLEEGDPDGERILRREPLVFVALAKYPYAPGHLLILPTRHVGDLEGLTDDEQSAITRLVRTSVRTLRDASEPHGFNIGLNLARRDVREASATVRSGLTRCGRDRSSSRTAAGSRSTSRATGRTWCCCTPDCGIGAPGTGR